MSEIHITQISPDQLSLYDSVPISFWVHSIFQVELIDGGLGGIRLEEAPVAPPYLKDYDSFEKPSQWAGQFDLSAWKMYLAYVDGTLAGAAALVMDSPGIHLLDGRNDLAVLWDLRVAPEFRGQGVGRALFQHASDCARKAGKAQMKIETQNINTRACRFYRAMGCTLGAIHRHFYEFDPPSKHEVALLWYLDL